MFQKNGRKREKKFEKKLKSRTYLTDHRKIYQIKIFFCGKHFLSQEFLYYVIELNHDSNPILRNTLTMDRNR